MAIGRFQQRYWINSGHSLCGKLTAKGGLHHIKVPAAQFLISFEGCSRPWETIWVRSFMSEVRVFPCLSGGMVVSWFQGFHSQRWVFPTSQKGFQPTLRDTVIDWSQRLRCLFGLQRQTPESWVSHFISLIFQSPSPLFKKRFYYLFEREITERE